MIGQFIHHDLNINFIESLLVLVNYPVQKSQRTLFYLPRYIQTIHLEQNHHLLLLHLIYLTLFLLQATLVFLIQMSIVRTQILIYKYTINPQYHNLSLLAITLTKLSDLVMKRLIPIHLLFTTFMLLPSKIVVTLQN